MCTKDSILFFNKTEDVRLISSKNISPSVRDQMAKTKLGFWLSLFADKTSQSLLANRTLDMGTNFSQSSPETE